MKNFRFKFIAGLALLIGSFLILNSFTNVQTTTQDSNPPENTFEIPADINEILQNKCFDCHNVNSEGEKAKKKLMIGQLSELSKSKLISKLDGIAETMKAGEMPPEKFLAKYPDYTPTEKETQKLIDWANSTADELLK